MGQFACNIQYSSNLYEIEINGQKNITYTEPAQGKPAGANPDKDSPVPSGMTRTGIIHSHAAYDPNYKNNEFSGADKQYTTRRNVDIYVATPEGTLQRYDVKTGTEYIQSTDLPSDPKDPDRGNNIAPEKKPVIVE